jgi:hypothetical protein
MVLTVDFFQYHLNNNPIISYSFRTIQFKMFNFETIIQIAISCLLKYTNTLNVELAEMH